ncbi:MAG: TonB family protein [Methylocystis sp.]|nr:TonB family protein [Methylocystis sp.]
MTDTAQHRRTGAAFAAAAMERLFEPRGRGLRPRPRFLAFLLLCLFLHIVVFAFLLWQDRRSILDMPPIEEEIPVEVVTEPPPQPKPEEPPPPEPEKPPEQKQQERQKPPPPPPAQEYEKPAFDAPKAESKTKSEVDADKQQEKLTTPRVAPPTEKTAPKDEKPEGLKDATEEEGKAEKPDEAAKAVEDKPDAEIIEKAEPKEKPLDKPEAKNQGPAKKGEGNTIAEQVARLEPLPSYELAAPPKPSPVGGGQAKTTYLTILYGLIMPHMQIPPHVRGMQAKGVVAFYVDEMGNLVHQAVYRSSGAPELDAAAIMAVRRAAPFPPPPRGLPHSMLFTYATR